MTLDAGDMHMSFSDDEDSHTDELLLAVDPPPRADFDNSELVPANDAVDDRRKRPRATVEDAEDEDDSWIQPCPPEREAGAILGACKTRFEKMLEEQRKKGHAPWEPFESEDEWELARWLMTAGLSNKKTDEYLKLKTVRTI
jgi:hypothetical protein